MEEILGRAAEQHLIVSALDEARHGVSSVMVLRGEPGIGKSTLLAYGEECATEMTVLRTCGIESEVELPFAGLADVLGPILAPMDELPTPQSAALKGALALDTPVPGDRFSVCAATLTLVARAAEESPVLVVVDDAQWLDTASGEALLFTARRIRAEGILMLFAARSDDQSPLDGSDLPKLDLEGLDENASRDLLSGRVHCPFSDKVATELFVATAGNPLALGELIDSLSHDQLAGAVPLDDPLPVGVNTERMFRRRFVQLSAAARHLLVILAAAGPTDRAVFGAIATSVGLNLSDLDQAESTEIVGLVGTKLEFHHPLLRSVAYRDATAEDRREAHRVIASFLGKNLADTADRRAWHLAVATVGSDELVAALLEETSERASVRGGHAAAARACEKAAQLTLPGEDRARRLLKAASAAQLAGQPHFVLRLLDQVDTQDRLLNADIEYLRGTVEMWVHGPTASKQLFQRVAGGLEDSDPWRASVMLMAATNCSIMEGSLGEALALARKVVMLSSGADAATATLARMLLATTQIFVGETRAGRESLQDVDMMGIAPALAVQSVGNLAMPLLWVEEHQRAKRVIEAVVALGRERSALAILPYPLACLAEVDFHLGSWEAAYASATESEQLAVEVDQESTLAFSFIALSRIEAARGMEAECRSHLQRALDMAAELGVGSLEVYASNGMGFLELSLGNPEAAIEHLERVQTLVEMGGLGNPLVLGQHPNLIEAYVHVGSRENAIRILGILEQQATTTSNSWALAVSARCRGILAGPGEDDVHFKEALRLHGRTPTPFERARTELCWGESLRRGLRRKESIAPLKSALHVFEELGADPWAERTRRELRAAGGRPRRRNSGSAGSLTPQELQVARAVSNGLSNPEVATALFLSRKTVEFHLSNAYRKLGVRSRTELTRRFATVEGRAFAAR